MLQNLHNIIIYNNKHNFCRFSFHINFIFSLPGQLRPGYSLGKKINSYVMWRVLLPWHPIKMRWGLQTPPKRSSEKVTVAANIKREGCGTT